MAPRGEVGTLIDRQMRRWELQRPRASSSALRPCIAISRLPYAGGGTLGRAAADRLDYGFFDRELLDLIAREHGVQRRIVEGVDEQVLTGIEKFVSDVFRLRSFTQSDYLRQTVRVVSSIAAQGAAVLVGRGAPQILTADRALRVLVVAGADHRARRLAEDEDLTRQEATRRLVELDAKRADFSLRQLGVRQDDPTLYDLVVNTGTVGLDGAVELVVEALRRRFPAAAPRDRAAR